MNLRFLEAFYWIAKLGSFSAAAAKLHATPAAISERIRTLEEDLGVRVFERDSRKVSLTAHGQRLLPYAEQMLALRDAMKETVRDPGAQTGIISGTVMRANGRVLPTYSLVSPTEDRRFLLNNQDELFLRYNALLLTLDKRWSGTGLLDG